MIEKLAMQAMEIVIYATIVVVMIIYAARWIKSIWDGDSGW